MITTVWHEIKRLELTVPGSIPEVNHPDALGFNESYYIIGGKLVCRLSQELHQLIAAHKYVIVHRWFLLVDGQM